MFSGLLPTTILEPTCIFSPLYTVLKISSISYPYLKIQKIVNIYGDLPYILKKEPKLGPYEYVFNYATSLLWLSTHDILEPLQAIDIAWLSY